MPHRPPAPPPTARGATTHAPATICANHLMAPPAIVVRDACPFCQRRRPPVPRPGLLRTQTPPHCPPGPGGSARRPGRGFHRHRDGVSPRSLRVALLRRRPRHAARARGRRTCLATRRRPRRRRPGGRSPVVVAASNRRSGQRRGSRRRGRRPAPRGPTRTRHTGHARDASCLHARRRARAGAHLHADLAHTDHPCIGYAPANFTPANQPCSTGLPAHRPPAPLRRRRRPGPHRGRRQLRGP